MTDTTPTPENQPAGHPPEWGPPRSRTVTWFDPEQVRALTAGLTGRELIEGIIDGRIPPPPIANLVGTRLVSVADGEAVFRCVPDGSTYNPVGMVHGGLLCTLMDSAMGVAVQSTLAPGVRSATIELKVSFLRPVRVGAGELEIHGRALQVGRRVAFAEAHARDEVGTLVGHATSSLALIEGGPTVA
jgi:uncharacterized protein (TIGR00369 family)